MILSVNIIEYERKLLFFILFFITPEPLAMEVNHNIFQTTSYIFTHYAAWNIYRNSDN